MKEPLQLKVRKIGTSYGVIIPKKILDEMKIGKESILLIKDIEPVKQVDDIRGMFPGLTFRREHRIDRY